MDTGFGKGIHQKVWIQGKKCFSGFKGKGRGESLLLAGDDPLQILLQCERKQLNNVVYRMVQKFGTIFRMSWLYHLLTDLRNCFDVRIRRKFAIIPSLKIQPHLKCVATLPCEMSLSGANGRSLSLISPLVSGVAGLNASSSSNVDTWCKNCRMWQLLQTITETLNMLFPVVNFFKMCCYRSRFVFSFF